MKNFKAFSLIELMVVVVIISVLSAIAVPQYQNYIRRSRTSEATSNINSIGLYQEQYFSENNQYLSLNVNPAAGIPNWDDPGGTLPFNSTEPTWVELGSVFPDDTALRFQYEVLSGRYDSAAAHDIGDNPTTDFAYVTNSDCDDTAEYEPADWVIAAPFAWWYTVIAVGNQKESPDGMCSIFAKISSRTQIYSENELD